jgi:ketosteroid isomerase-like protein
MAALRGAFDVGFTGVTIDHVAVRGERLAVFRSTFTTDTGMQLVLLSVGEADADGLVSHVSLYDAESLAEALVELDRRYAAGEGAQHAAVIELLAEGYAAMNRRDLDGWAAIHAENHIFHDHSPIGFGELDTQGYRAYLEAVIEQDPDFVFIPATLDVAGTVTLVYLPARSTTADGFAWENDVLIVTRFDDHHAVEAHVYSVDQQSGARAMFESLAAQSERSASPVQNTLTVSLLDLLALRASEGAIDPTLVANDIVIIDRRTGVSAGTLTGREQFVANLSAHFDVFERIVPTVVAVRGERLALLRMEFAADGFVSGRLNIFETNANGQLTALVVFDEDDLAAALDELEERFIAGDGAAHEYAIRRHGDVRRAATAADPAAAYRALHTPDCAVTDHRLFSWPTETPADIVDEVMADRGISRPRATLFASLEIQGDAALVTQDDRFVTPEGSEYLKRSLVVAHMVAGLTDHVDFYDPEQHDAARARFEEAGVETRTPHIENAVVRKIARGLWLQQYGEQADSSAEYADDLVLDDRRTGVTLPQLHGADELIEASRAQDELFGPTAIEPVAVRGDRLALTHTRAVAPSGFEVVGYMTFEIGDDGRFCRMVCFDDTDLVGALDTLEQRYAEIARDSRNPAEAVVIAGTQALNHRDWDAFESIHHPEMVALDHTPLGFAPTDRDGFLNEQMRGLAALVEDFVVVPAKIMTSGPAVLVIGHGTGTTVEGSTYEWHWVCAGRVVDGLVTHQEFFDDTDWAAALTRFDQLAGEPAAAATEPENRLTRQLRQSIVLAEQRDPTYADVLADDVVILDRRSGISAGTITGRADFTANARAHFDVFVHASPTILEVRGDRLALVRMEYQADGFVSVRLNLFQTNPDGQLTALVVLDEDALAAACEELEARHTAIETGS